MALTVVRGTRGEATTGTLNLASLTVATNDVIVVTIESDANFAVPVHTLSKVSGTATIGTVTNNEVRRSGGLGGNAAVSWFRVTAGGTLVVGVATTTIRTTATPWVITGADTTDCIGSQNTGASTTNSINADLTTTTANSIVMFNGQDYQGLGVPSSSNITDFDPYTNANYSGGGGYRAAPTVGNITGNLDAFGAGAPDWAWCTLEILASPAVVPNAPSIPAGGYGYNNATFVPITAGASVTDPVTDFTVDFALASAPTTWLGPFVDGSPSTELFRYVTGLTVGTAYVFRAKATNIVGDSAWSATSASITATNSNGPLDLQNGDSLLLQNGNVLHLEAD